ncbi:hypothetical protein V1281_004295 [Nitrobacteraceae bacterium AZCC 2161]
MTRHSGSSDLPLHGGRVPQWLADRMSSLGAVVCQAIVHHYGREPLGLSLEQQGLTEAHLLRKTGSGIEFDHARDRLTPACDQTDLGAKRRKPPQRAAHPCRLPANFIRLLARRDESLHLLKRRPRRLGPNEIEEKHDFEIALDRLAAEVIERQARPRRLRRASRPHSFDMPRPGQKTWRQFGWRLLVRPQRRPQSLSAKRTVRERRHDERQDCRLTFSVGPPSRITGAGPACLWSNAYTKRQLPS